MLRKESIALKKNVKKNNKSNLKSKTIVDTTVLERRLEQAKAKK